MDKGERLDAVVAQACEMIKTPGISCVVIDGEKIVHTADGRGVAPLLDLYGNHREMLKGARVVDRVVGKAAAMILILGQAAYAYGDVMSESAQDYLAKRGVPFSYGVCVDRISGQDGTGVCPIEASVLSIDEPEAGLAAIRHRVAELRGAAVWGE